MIISIIILSISCLLISSVIAGFSPKIFKKTKKLKPIYILLAGAFLATLVLLLYVDYKPQVHGKGTTFFLAVFHSIQVMLLGYDFEFLYEAFSITEKYSAFAYAYLSLLFFLSPAYTFGFVLSFFESITSYIKYVFKFKSDIYVLSDLSEKSLMLASSIRKKAPKALIVFTHEAKDSDPDFSDKLKEVKAIRLKKDIADVGLKLHSKASKATFFTMSENESVNLEASLKLIDRFRERKNTDLFVFSTSKEGELLLDTVEDGYMKVRRINEDRSFAYSIISDMPITDNYTEHDGKKIISTLIVGFGGYGSELTKALLWCGQLPNYELEINIIDKNPLTESKFKAACPEILSLNHNSALGEAKYDLNFYNDIDVLSYRFCETISELKNTSVVYVSLGNDELNIETAINIRILFERIGLYPVIRAIVYSDIKCKTLKDRNLLNYCGKSYDIEIIGNIEKRFDYDTIVNEKLEELALECHMRWSKTPEDKERDIKKFNEYEYYRNSSAATAIHEKYRERANIEGESAAMYEHMRWNAYMRTEGFIYSGSTEKATRNDRAKMHNNLHRFGLLDDESVDKDIRITKRSNSK